MMNHYAAETAGFSKVQKSGNGDIAAYLAKAGDDAWAAKG